MGVDGGCGGASAPSLFRELNGSPEDSVNLFFCFPKRFSPLPVRSDNPIAG